MKALSAPYDVKWLGTVYKVLLTAAQSGGRTGMVESFNPPGSASPSHVLAEQSKTFYIRSGIVGFWIGGRFTVKGQGETVSVPRGTEHRFQILGDSPARILTVVKPGGFEGFYAEVARENCQIPKDSGRIAQIAERFGMTFTDTDTDLFVPKNCRSEATVF